MQPTMQQMHMRIIYKPAGIDPKYCPDYLLKAACDAWDKAVQMGEKYGIETLRQQ
jgi:hypothetical protein